MKPRKQPMRRTELQRGQPLARTTPLRRAGIARPTAAGVSSEPRNARPKQGPVKARSESTHIPRPIRLATLARDAYRCQRCGHRLAPWWYSLQHRDARGMGGSKLLHRLANLVALCGTATTGCHGYVESQRTESYALGWLVPNGAVPEEWPVLRFQRSWEQPGETWETAQPTARQIEMRGAA